MSRTGPWPPSLSLIMALLIVGTSVISACRTRPSSPAPKDASAASPASVPVPLPAHLVIAPTSAVTNEDQFVTYTFDLPRPALRGYIIEESPDGMTWTELGRSSSTNFTRVTVMGSKPSSGNRYRVILP